ncbi:pspC domain protein [Clostridium sp. CAG:628]|jgi:phage shock protein C|nr:pspC domain protein [Clostridium sp. CAG:628]
MKEKRLYRVNEGKILCGVCMGLSEYFEIDVTIVRLIWVFISLVYGSGLLLYIIAALIMPIKPPIKKVN